MGELIDKSFEKRKNEEEIDKGVVCMIDLKKGLPISLKIATKVIQNGEIQDYLFELFGQAVKIGDTLYLRYKEELPDEVPVSVTFKLLPDGVIQLTRAGETRTRLKFAYKEKVETSYPTPYGTMFFTTFTDYMHVSLKDRPFSGNINISYDLLMMEEKVGEYQLSLEFTA